MSLTFEQVLKNGDKNALADFAKSDLHNHAVFSCDRDYLLKAGYNVPSPNSVCNIATLIAYARNNIKPIQNNLQGLRCLLQGLISKCLLSGVSVVDSDIDYKICITLFESNVTKFVEFLQNISHPQLTIRWIIDISRDSYIQDQHENVIIQMLQSGFFAGVDLTSTENCVPNSSFKNIYAIANKLNLTTKVHAGEQLGADYIKQCIIDFNPKQIQHGITIVQDTQVMQLAKDRNIIFNVCPTSNVVLGYATDIEHHPIKQMVDFGLKVTLATDDALLFDTDINNEYLKLYNNKVLSAQQLNEIRLFGLSV